MDRKVLTALVLSLGIFVLWTRYVMVPPEEKPAAQTAGEKTEEKTAEKAAAPTETTAKPGDAKAEAKAGETTSAAPHTRQPESFTAVEIPGHARATLSSWGAALHDFVLLEPRYKERSGGKDVPIDLVQPKDAPLPYSVRFGEGGLDLPVDADFALQPGHQPNDPVYTWDGGTTHVEKRWHFDPKSYEGRLEILVENRGDKPLTAAPQLILGGQQDPEVQPSLFKPSVIQTEAICSAGKAKRESLSSLLKEPLDVTGPVRLVAIDRKYFVLAAAMVPVEGARCHVEAQKSGRIKATLSLPASTIAPGSKQSWSFTTFVGPKTVSELDAARVGPPGAEQDAHLGEVMNYGFTEIFVRPLLWVLKSVHRGVANWGLAIIVLTLLLKLVTWWPTAQSMKSAQAMAKLKPEMDKLREKHGDDKQRMNQEVMALYQKHKINPLGGCLPVLIQMPIYIAFYSMLGNSIELYRSALGLWIHDLTAPDPFFVLPLATGALMFLQQRFSPAPVDPQQKTMMTMMPLMFTGMSIFLPAGLTLYILTNTGLGILQQRLLAPKDSTPTTTTADASAKKKKKADR